MDTCLPLIPPTERDGCLEDPSKHLTISISELALGDDPPDCGIHVLILEPSL